MAVALRGMAAAHGHGLFYDVPYGMACDWPSVDDTWWNEDGDWLDDVVQSGGEEECQHRIPCSSAANEEGPHDTASVAAYGRSEGQSPCLRGLELVSHTSQEVLSAVLPAISSGPSGRQSPPVRPKLSRRAAIAARVMMLLEGPLAACADNVQRDGSVCARTLLKLDPWLASRCVDSSRTLLRSISGTPNYHFAVDSKLGTVRLLSTPRRLVLLTEQHLVNTPHLLGRSSVAGLQGASVKTQCVRLRDLQWTPEVQRLLQAVLPQGSGGYQLCSAAGHSGRREAWTESWECTRSQLEAARLDFLRKALLVEGSDRFEVWQSSDRSAESVAMRPLGCLLCRAVEALLDRNPKAAVILSREGEVPLSWIAEQSDIVAELRRACIPLGEEIALEALREAVATESTRYELQGDGPRASIHPIAFKPAASQLASSPAQAILTTADSSHSFNLPTLIPACSSAVGKGAGVAPSPGISPTLVESKSSQHVGPRLVPPSRVGAPGGAPGGAPPPVSPGSSAKSARLFRDLLEFYFQPFNLQHNRVLMSLVESQRLGCGGHSPQSCSKHSVSSQSQGGAPLVFKISDIAVLPRLGRFLNGFLRPNRGGADQQLRHKHSQFLVSAFLGGQDSGIFSNQALRLIMRKSGAPMLELTRVPPLRHLEFSKPLCKDLQGFLKPVASIYTPVEGLPAHVVVVISYSISSDLSHSQSPKAIDALEAVYRGGLDPSLLTWEIRLQRLKRQLLHYEADILCIQALQSIGFAERCSERDHGWFGCEDEPVVNHLVHLFRELSKANYGVVFAPTLKLPGSATICLGNAVFWKRSRWQLKSQCALENSGLSVVLESRLDGSCIGVCSSKAAASYALEWGDCMSMEECLRPMQRISDRLVVEAADIPMVWCGDFSCEPQVLGAGQPSTTMTCWKSASKVLLGYEPWTSASRHSFGKTVDYALYNERIRPIAVLGGWPGSCDATELIGAGYPSDHLMLVTVFSTQQSNVDDEDLRVESMNSRQGTLRRQAGSGVTSKSDGSRTSRGSNDMQEFDK